MLETVGDDKVRAGWDQDGQKPEARLGDGHGGGGAIEFGQLRGGEAYDSSVLQCVEVYERGGIGRCGDEEDECVLTRGWGGAKMKRAAGRINLHRHCHCIFHHKD